MSSTAKLATLRCEGEPTDAVLCGCRSCVGVMCCAIKLTSQHVLHSHESGELSIVVGESFFFLVANSI